MAKSKKSKGKSKKQADAEPVLSEAPEQVDEPESSENDADGADDTSRESDESDGDDAASADDSETDEVEASGAADASDGDDGDAAAADDGDASTGDDADASAGNDADGSAGDDTKDADDGAASDEPTPASSAPATLGDDVRGAPPEATGPVVGVTVYARGAWVTRRIEVGDALAGGQRSLRITGITPLAEPGSFRAAVRTSDDGIEPPRVLGISSRIEVPGEGAIPGPLRAKARTLRARETRLRDELNILEARAHKLASVEPEAAMYVRSVRYDAASSMADALAADEVLDERIAANQARIAELKSEMSRVALEIRQAEVDASQASGGERTGEGHPTRSALIRMAPTGTADTVDASTIELSYRVPAARWWPTYTVRLDHDALEATVEIEAWVAQCTLEDWTDVEIALATANMHRDTALPELPMWRMGRAQRLPKRGFRPPPPGVETLFASYDAAVGGTPSAGGAGPAPHAPASERSPEPVSSAVAHTVGIAPSAPPPPQSVGGSGKHDRVLATTAISYDFDDEGAPKLEEESESYGSVPTPSMYIQSQAKSRSRGISLGDVEATMAVDIAALGLAGGPPGGGGPAKAKKKQVSALDVDAAGAPLDPGEQWLDYDGLVLADPESPRRGRLVQRQTRDVGVAWMTELEGMTPPGVVVDPARTRGEFDHIYRATGRVDVPANDTVHRIAVESRTAEVRSRFRTVPVERAEVFREVTLRNPFDGPLLEGSADVFLSGSMVATAQVEAVDRGGFLTIGLGVEDRLRVARNARVDEHKSGIFGGKSVVEHHIAIEVASALGHDATVEVVDRVPSTNDDEIDVELGKTEPAAETYDQSERGEPVEGGLRWTLDVPAGGKATAAFDYELKLPAKREIIGGNRRD